MERLGVSVKSESSLLVSVCLSDSGVSTTGFCDAPGVGPAGSSFSTHRLHEQAFITGMVMVE